MDIVKEANQVLNSNFKIINQDRDECIEITEDTELTYGEKYAEYEGRKTFLGYNLYASNGNKKTLLGTYDDAMAVVAIKLIIKIALFSGEKEYFMPEGV